LNTQGQECWERRITGDYPGGWLPPDLSTDANMETKAFGGGLQQVLSIKGSLRAKPRGSMATRSSILAWRIPMDRGAWRTTVHGIVKGRTRLSD